MRQQLSNMKILNDIEQGTDAWLEVRKGKMTASHGQEIGNCGKGLDTYIHNLMAEFYSSGEKEYFSNKAIEMGNELEDQARSVYALDVGMKVEEVGFMELSEYVGCSPDGLVGDDGMVEIKCPNDANYFKFLLDGEKAIASKYIWQMQMQMMIAKRDWCDFVAYNPNFEQSKFVHRVYPDEVKYKKLMAGLDMGIEKIKIIKSKVK